MTQPLRIFSFWTAILIVTCCCSITCLCVASQSSDSSLYYTSVTALDKYGESVQLRHARASSLRYGTLIVAAKSIDKDIVVVSVHTSRPGVLNRKRGVLEPMVASDKIYNGCVYMACAGVKADASWLIRTTREHNVKTWERYSSSPSLPRVASAISEALLQFMGYDRSLEWHDGVGAVLPKQNQDDNEQDNNNAWSRPLGVQSLLLSFQEPHFVVVEPSGIQHSHYAHAIGRDSDLVNEALRKKYKRSLDTKQVKELLIQVIQKALLEESNEKVSDKAELVVEIVSSQGTSVTVEPLKKNKS